MRSVKPEFFTDEDITQQPPLHRLAFEGLWCHSDRMGRLEDKPRELKTKILPYDACDFDALLTDLHTAGFIVRYIATGKDGVLRKLIWVVHFLDHQRPHKDEKPSVLPEFNAKTSKLLVAPPNIGADHVRAPLEGVVKVPGAGAGTGAGAGAGDGSLELVEKISPASPEPNQKQLIDDDARKEPKQRSKSVWEDLWERMCTWRRKKLEDLGLGELEDEKVGPALVNTALKRCYDHLAALNDGTCTDPEDLLLAWVRGYLESDFGAGTEPPYCFKGFVAEKVIEKWHDAATLFIAEKNREAEG